MIIGPEPLCGIILLLIDCFDRIVRQPVVTVNRGKYIMSAPVLSGQRTPITGTSHIFEIVQPKRASSGGVSAVEHTDTPYAPSDHGPTQLGIWLMFPVFTQHQGLQMEPQTRLSYLPASWSSICVSNLADA